MDEIELEMKAVLRSKSKNNKYGRKEYYGLGPLPYEVAKQMGEDKYIVRIVKKAGDANGN